MERRHPKFERITFDPARGGGKACVRGRSGSHMTVEALVAYIANGWTRDKIRTDWPDIEDEDVTQALAFAAWASGKVAAPDQRVLVHFAANVRKQRVRRGLTQQELAAQIGVDLRWLQRVEAASINATLLTLDRIATVLGVDPNALLRKAELSPPKKGRPPRAASVRR